MFRLAPLLLFLVLACGLAAETYEDILDGADLGSAEVQLDIGRWCKKHKMWTTANKHFKRALEIDPNHEETRWEMGFVMVDDRWVHKSKVPGYKEPTGKVDNGDVDPGGVGTDPVVTGPGPKAADIKWNVTVWPNPDKENHHSGFLDGFVRQLAGEESMWDAIATLTQEKYVTISVQRVAQALADGQRILGGAAMLCADLSRKDKMAGTAKSMKFIRRLLPFLVKASEAESNPDALYMFSSVAALVGDKQVIPRLIELLGAGNDDVVSGAKNAISYITMLPKEQVDVTSAQNWWDRYHGLSDADVFALALTSKDPLVRYEGCQRLYAFQDKRIVPVLIDLVGDNDSSLAISSAELLRRITGTDWQVKLSTTQEKRKEIVKTLKGWWADKGPGYTFVEFRNEVPETPEQVEVDLTQKLVDQLDDLDMTVADKAFVALQNKGDEVVDALITNLGSTSKIRAQKCRDLLRAITKQSFGFDAYAGDEPAKQEAISKWRAWRDAALMQQEEAALKKAAETTPTKPAE